MIPLVWDHLLAVVTPPKVLGFIAIKCFYLGQLNKTSTLAKTAREVQNLLNQMYKVSDQPARHTVCLVLMYDRLL